MASSINASLTTGLTTTADTSGILNLQSNGTTVASVSSTGVAVTGNITASGATGGIGYGPAFSASLIATNQAITSGVSTKLQFSVENFDTNSCYDPTTNYRFTPNVAGYYQINLTCYTAGTALTQQNLYIYKNGSATSSTVIISPSNTVSGAFTAAVIYCNGSTDYIEAYTAVTGTSPLVQATVLTQFSGAMVRSA